MSSHLFFSNQTYIDHFKDSIQYSFRALKAGVYFLIHAIVPDFYVSAGSEEIHELEVIIQHKYSIIDNDYDMYA